MPFFLKITRHKLATKPKTPLGLHLYIIDFQRVNWKYKTIIVNPWGVEPQSKEPESFILSIELRVQMARLRPTLGWSGALWVEGHFGWNVEGFLKMRGKFTTSRAQNKEILFFFCRGRVSSPIYRQHYGFFCNFAAANAKNDTYWTRSSMDRIKDSGSFDWGSTPHGFTI